MAPLKGLVQEADAEGLKNISGSYAGAGRGLMNARQYPAAKKQLETALNASEKLGLQMLQARSQYLLGRTLELSGSGTEAAGHYAEAKRMLEGIRQESGSDAILKRQDLAGISAH